MWIVTYKHGIYEFPHKLPNDLRLRILGNYKRSRKCLNFIVWWPKFLQLHSAIWVLWCWCCESGPTCSKFRNELKQAVTMTHKETPKLSKENYRPISILSNISKIHERCLHDQIATYFENTASFLIINGFRKRYSTQYYLLAVTKKWKKIVNVRGIFAWLLIDVYKAFDWILHDLTVAKLVAH